MKFTDLIKIIWLPVIIASLCQLSPIVLILFGLSSLAFASSLTHTLCGDYMWAFRLIGALFLFTSLVHFFRQRGVKTCIQAKKQMNQIINLSLLVILFAVLSYIFLFYTLLVCIQNRIGLPTMPL